MPELAQLIRDDHEQIRQQFYRLERTATSPERRKRLMDGLLIDLQAHARMEERFFYPVVSRLFGDDGCTVEKGQEAHREIRRHIAALTRMDPADDAYLPTCIALRQLTERHMREEEQELLPAVEQAAQDGLRAIALEMESRWPQCRRDAARLVRRARFATLRRMPSQFFYLAWRIRLLTRGNVTAVHR